jgi:hypothetical protein
MVLVFCPPHKFMHIPYFLSITGNNKNAYGVLPVAFHQNLSSNSSDKNIQTGGWTRLALYVINLMPIMHRMNQKVKIKY